jgi:hypothetical protein
MAFKDDDLGYSMKMMFAPEYLVLENLNLDEFIEDIPLYLNVNDMLKGK